MWGLAGVKRFLVLGVLLVLQSPVPCGQIHWLRTRQRGPGRRTRRLRKILALIGIRRCGGGEVGGGGR